MGCLESISANDYPKDRLEVLVVDGMSEDRTRVIVQSYAQRCGFIRLLDNPRGITPAALNIGIKNSKGEVIIRMDAHSEYPPQYVSTCLEYLSRVEADVVGGPIVTRPGADTVIARSIALATSCPFGVGNSRFRTSTTEGYVDTVPFGAYKRDVFRKVGLFDERLARNQDNEMSCRIINSGGKIYLTPELMAYYYNQATISGLLRQALRTGVWNVITLKINPAAFCWRHFIPFVFVTVLLVLGFLASLHSGTRVAFFALVGLYCAAAGTSSLYIGLKEGIRYTWILPLLFFLYHFCYGLGTWAGLLKIVFTGWGGGSNSGSVQQDNPAEEGRKV